jgi:mannose-6-phosphate isomerase class I
MSGVNLPFLLRPSAKKYLWGGSRLNDDFNLGLDADSLAEAWVCSTHPDGESKISTGESLRSVLENHPDYLGTHALSLVNGRVDLPILIKLIDAKKDLSIQVHPDDKYASIHEHSLGKTEMWYVLDAKPDSSLIYGFSRDVNAATVRDAINTGRIGRYLNTVKVKKNDVFLVEPGTVHAIGAGCLIAEIQESSNITYRLFDYDRIDKNGTKRELHIKRALDVANLSSSATPRQPMRVLKYKPGYASELLTSCKYFRIERLLLNTEICRDLVEFKTGSNSFHALLCVDGCGSILLDRGMLNFFKGDCVFVPAESVLLKLHGKAQILNVSC